MHVLGALEKCVYFVPVIGTLYHAREEQCLSRELDAISTFAPSLRTLKGRVHQFAESLDEIRPLPVDQKIRISNYLEKRNTVNQLAFWGSNVQALTLCAVQGYSPVFLVLARCEIFHTLYGLFKLCIAPARYYHYNQATGGDETRRREFFGESRFLSFSGN